MIVHSHANILDFKEKAFSLYFFMHCLSLLPSKIDYGGLAPWPIGVSWYRLFRLYLPSDCTSMLNLQSRGTTYSCTSTPAMTVARGMGKPALTS